MQISRNKDRTANVSRATLQTETLKETEKEGLVRRAAGGDTQAFGELYSIYLDRIYLYVSHLVHDRVSAEDVTEEVFIRAWGAIKSCKGREQTFLPWLYRVAHNAIVDSYRKERKELSIQTDLEIESIADVSNDAVSIETKQERQQLLKEIGFLPPNQQQIIFLKFIEGLDNKVIAQVLHKQEGAIRVMQMRALATLRQRIQRTW